MWRAELDRLPTRSALLRRGIDVGNVLCPFVTAFEEDCRHIFVDCGYSNGVWNMIYRWCRLDPIYCFDFEDILLVYKNVHGGKWRKKNSERNRHGDSVGNLEGEE